MHRILGWLLILLTVALPAAGQLPGGLLGSGEDDLINLPISLPIPLAGLTVSFEDGVNLSLLNLGAGVFLVNPGDPDLLARLPPGVTIAPELPLLVRIEPPPAGGLAFTGVTQIDYLGVVLLPSASTSRRVYAAPTGGSFIDITDQVHIASIYRVIGTRGEFSEFLVVNDPTPPAQMIPAKLARLSQALTANAAAIPAPVYAELAARLADVEAHWTQGDTAAALDELALFLATVEQQSGTGIPDLWRAARDRVNVAGLLRAAARTLRFSLRQDLDP